MTTDEVDDEMPGAACPFERPSDLDPHRAISVGAMAAPGRLGYGEPPELAEGRSSSRRAPIP